MAYKKQFEPSHVLNALEGSPGMMLIKLQEAVGCSEMTLRRLLNPLIASGEVIKLNIGASDKKPVNLYKRKEG